MSRALRRALRRWIGLWPLLEARNRVTSPLATARVRRREDREVARLSPAARDWQAEVVTVIPTRGRPQLLPVAVRSALAQTVRDHLVVVVDDGGGLPALPADPRLRSVSLTERPGTLGAVRNVGVRLTRSRYVAFLDDDNTWEPHHLETALARLGRDGADLVYTSVARSLPDGQRLDVLGRAFDRRVLADAEDGVVDANALVVRRDPGVLFSRLPRVRATLPKEDWEFVYRLSRTRRVVHEPAVTVHYLVNPESTLTDWRGLGG